MEAYGPKQPDMIVEFPKTQFPADLNPTIGMALTMNNGQGQQFQVISGRSERRSGGIRCQSFFSWPRLNLCFRIGENRFSINNYYALKGFIDFYKMSRVLLRCRDIFIIFNYGIRIIRSSRSFIEICTSRYTERPLFH